MFFVFPYGIETDLVLFMGTEQNNYAHAAQSDQPFPDPC